MKMQVLYSAKTDNAQIVADKISREFKSKCDQIPPAYPCENEKLVFIIVDNYGKFDKKLINFCNDLTESRASNVAFINISKAGDDNIGELKDIMNKNKVNIAGIHGIAIKKGLFGYGKITEEQVAGAMKFAEDEVKALFTSI